MRLTPAQIDTIKTTAQAVLGEGTQVTLFGSRVDDDKKGGDIDLLVESSIPVINKPQVVGKMYAQLIRQLGDRKIDILVKDPTSVPTAVFEIALQTGIRL